MTTIKGILQPVMLRRTKETKAENGENILGLPPKNQEIVKVKFSSQERDFYNAIEQ